MQARLVRQATVVQLYFVPAPATDMWTAVMPVAKSYCRLKASVAEGLPGGR